MDGWAGAWKNLKETPPMFLELFHRSRTSGERARGKAVGVDGKPLLRVDGPHAAPAQHYSEYREAMIVGAGIGLTPAASILQEVLKYKWI